MRFALLAVLSLLLSACASHNSPDYRAEGLASYYGARHHGHKTASGETFNQYALTAAHRTLPFGSLVQVTNLNNGKSVVVRINDRGPYNRKRLIDLSYQAAKDLAMLRDGVVTVSLEQLPN